MNFSNNMKKMTIAGSLMFTLLCGCAEVAVPEEQQPVSPEVSYGIVEDAFEVYVNSPVELKAVIETPGPVECGWYVTKAGGEEEKIASTPTVTYLFPEMAEYTVRFEAYNEAGRAGRSWKVTAGGIPLEVAADIEPGNISATVGDRIQITVGAVSGGEGIEHSWTLENEDRPEQSAEISDGELFEHVFKEAGNYVLTYTGTNVYNMQARMTWTITVSDKPLEVSFSLPGTSIGCVTRLPVVISATVLYGSAGLEQTWTVDGTEYGHDALLKYTFTNAGSHTIEYSAVNVAGETFRHIWDVTVTDYVDGLMLFDFEALSSLPSANFKADQDYVTLEDNPEVTALNPSSKVIKVDKSSSGSTSGFFDISGISLSGASEYTKIRMKVWLGNNPYYPRLMIIKGSPHPNLLPSSINGQAFDTSNPTEAAWKALIYTDDWNILEYSLSGTAFTDFGEITQIQPRPIVDIDGNNVSGATSDDNTRIVWYDDIEFLK